MTAADLFGKGNESFVDENYEEAVELYSKAIEAQGERNERADFFSARAQAYLKLADYKSAVWDATKATNLDPENIKGYIRLGTSEFHLGEYASARTSFITAKALGNETRSVEEWIRKCDAEINLSERVAAGDQSDLPHGVSGTAATSASPPDPKHQATPVPSSQPEPPAPTSDPIPAEPEPAPKPAPVMPTGPKTRYDWYQTETLVVVTVMIKNVKKEDLSTNILDDTLSLTVKLPGGSEYSLELDLAHKISPQHTQIKILSTKVEIKLRKEEGIRWEKLEGDGKSDSLKHFIPEPTDKKPTYPSSSKHTHDWDKLAAEVTEEEKNEKVEGDAALNKLFQQIYSDGSDEVKRAMNKSFSQSGGTVLSTNWEEIGTKDVEVKPPDGMEYKKY